MELQNKKLTNDEFYTIQKEILTQWPTGADVDLIMRWNFIKAFRTEKISAKSSRRQKRKEER